MKTAIVTGATGFYGHHLVKYLLRTTDWDIVAMGRENFVGNINRIYELEEFQNNKNRVRVLWHDLRSYINPTVANQITNNSAVNYIFHVAASSHVSRSIVDPLSFVYDNVVGTAHMLEFSRQLKTLEKFIYFSTDEVFGPVQTNGYKFVPNDRYNACNPYSATKAGGEELSVAYCNTYNIPVVITHCMNILGERQHPEKYLPMVIKSILEDTEINVHTHNNSNIPGKRHYIYADEVSNALMFIFENGKVGEKYNIEGQKELNNLDLAQHVAKILNRPLKYKLIPGEKDRPGHDFDYAISGEKIRQLGYKQKFNFEEMLDKTIEWYALNRQWL